MADGAVGEICKVCGFLIEQHVQPGYVGEPHCSEFCAVATPEEKAAYVAGLPEGEFALYPCKESGCPIQDEYRATTDCCASCSTKRKARVRGELLKRARLHCIWATDLELAAEIDKELRR